MEYNLYTYSSVVLCDDQINVYVILPKEISLLLVQKVWRNIHGKLYPNQRKKNQMNQVL